jgi:excisionase family DNA binding protein
MAKDEKKSKEIPELVTLQEACELLRVHENTLRKWDEKGILKAVRFGEKKVRRYKKSDILALIEKGAK